MTGAAGSRKDPAAPPLAAGNELVKRLRDVHLRMVEAVLHGDGLAQVAALASGAVGAPVSIVVPRLGAAVLAGIPRDAELLAGISAHVADRVDGRVSEQPAIVLMQTPITMGDDLVGIVALLDGEGEPRSEAAEFLHIAAVAALTEIAVDEAREEVEENLRGSFLEDVRARPDLGAREIVRRAGRLGCDLSRGVVVLCAELKSDRPRHIVATISGDHPGSLAQHIDSGSAGGPGRVYALLPATGGDDAPERTLERARLLAERLGRHGTVGLSSFYTDAGELARAMQESELVLDVLRRSSGSSEALDDIGTGTYRLLFRVLASQPDEVRSFYEDTVAPVVRYDDQYRTELLATLTAYFEQNCNMNATATVIFAHRHTVAYRLERVKELTGLDPTQSEDRERLGLGLKAYRIIAPSLPR